MFRMQAAAASPVPARRSGCAAAQRRPRHLGLALGAALALCLPAGHRLGFLGGAAANPRAGSQALLSSRTRGCTSLRGNVCRNAKGFGKELVVTTVDVAEPAGGWPTLSVVVLSAESKMSTTAAVAQLGEQDYPVDRIAEIVVFGSQDAMKVVPQAFVPLLTEMTEPEASVASELSSLTGDMVAFWGDDHVSSPSRLKVQVAAALEAKTASALQTSWFYDAEEDGFLTVKEWTPPEEEEEEFELPESLKYTLTADPLSLCGKREAFIDMNDDMSSSENDDDMSPSIELQTLLINSAPKLVNDLPWASVRDPPAAGIYERGTPDKAIQKLAKSLAGKGRSKASFAPVLSKILDTKMPPDEAVTLLLSRDVKKILTKIELDNIEMAISDRLMRSKPAEQASTVSALREWPGLKEGHGSKQMARNFAVFFACFKAVRTRVTDDVDFYEMDMIADVAEGLVKLASEMWSMDAACTEALERTLVKELIPNSPGGGKGAVHMDVAGTLGLRRTMDSMAVAAADMPGLAFPVEVMSRLAWAMGQGQVASPGLQMKIAKSVVAQSQKLQPPDVGRLWIAIHEHKWFKDDTTVKYLLEVLVSRVNVLKASDPGLVTILDDSAEDAKKRLDQMDEEEKKVKEAVKAGALSGESR